MGPQQFIVPFCQIHLAACLLLAGAALRTSRHARTGSPLLPYVIAASLAAAVTVALVSIQWGFRNETWVDTSMLKMRFGGPYWWVYSAALMLPILPLLGILPPVRRRSRAMTGIAFGAAAGSGFLLTLF